MIGRTYAKLNSLFKRYALSAGPVEKNKLLRLVGIMCPNIFLYGEICLHIYTEYLDLGDPFNRFAVIMVTFFSRVGGLA